MRWADIGQAKRHTELNTANLHGNDNLRTLRLEEGRNIRT
jgi:hypothetical protein